MPRPRRMPRDERAAAAAAAAAAGARPRQRSGSRGQRSGCAQRRFSGGSCVAAGGADAASAAACPPRGARLPADPGARPTSRPSAGAAASGGGGGLQAASQGSEASGEPPRSAGRPSPDPFRVYGVSQVQDARRSGLPTRGLQAGGAAASGSKPSRVSSSGPAGRAPGARPAESADAVRSSVFAYLKVYGLNQYARAFLEVGLVDLESIGRLTETEGLEFLERLRVFPGHRLRLLRAIDCLRHAALGAQRRDAAQMVEEDAAFEKLFAQKEELSKEQSSMEDEQRRLQEENLRLLSAVQQQDAQLQRVLGRVRELEELVQAQTEQVNFFAQQLEIVARADPARETELFRSYRDTHEESQNDLAEAQRIQLPEATAVLGGDLGKSRAFTAEELDCAAAAAAAPASTAGPAGSGVATAVDGHTAASDALRRADRTTISPPRRARLAQSLDSAQVKECLAAFDVEHIIRCLATALQNKIILCVGRPRPHSASKECVGACAVFLEPVCHQKLQLQGASPLSSPCSPLMPLGSASGELGDAPTLCRLPDPLNALAARTIPSKWDIYGFLRDVMLNFRLEPEVSVITLFYLDRFSTLSGVALTPDNWQRVVITAMMLASKVWNDDSFENAEFAQLCPLYTLDEINTFERTFLKCVGYDMSVKGSEYAKTYFLLRTLGAKDSAEFGLEPLDNTRALRLAERCLEKQVEFRTRFLEAPAAVNAMLWTF